MFLTCLEHQRLANAGDSSHPSNTLQNAASRSLPRISTTPCFPRVTLSANRMIRHLVCRLVICDKAVCEVICFTHGRLIMVGVARKVGAVICFWMCNPPLPIISNEKSFWFFCTGDLAPLPLYAQFLHTKLSDNIQSTLVPIFALT